MKKNNFSPIDDICNKLFDDPKTNIKIDEIKVLDNRIKVKAHIIAPVKQIVLKCEI